MTGGSQDSAGIAGVIVLYRPDASILDHVNDLASTVDLLVVVINEAEPRLASELRSSRATVIANKDNRGLATALNQGIARGFSHPEIGFVLLLDQDSRPGRNMPTLLRAAYLDAENNGLRPACVAPTLVDIKAKSGASYGGSDRDRRSRSTAAVATSGSLIGRRAFEAVGPMRDDLFIDCIDYEWCFRARRSGYDVLQTPDATMAHDMGEMGVSLLGRYRPLYRSAIRHHYIVRNTVLLTRLRHVPIGWKLLSILKTLYRIPAYLFVSEDRPASLRRMASGLVEGLRISTRAGPGASA